MKNLSKLFALTLMASTIFCLAQESKQTTSNQNQMQEEAWICSENVMSDTIFQNRFTSKEECENYCNGVCEKTLQPKGFVQEETEMADFWSEGDETVIDNQNLEQK